MQTPQKPAPQAARPSSKSQKPQTENQISAQSDNDAYLAASREGDQTPSKKNRKPRKKSNARKNGVQSDVGEVQEQDAYRNVSHSTRPKNTPAKAIKSDAYAGPTFHQSPAASALPMPSFFSKSVPNATMVDTVVESTDGTSESKQEQHTSLAEKRESTPLDWMFQAARQSRGTPNGTSPARLLSPMSGSPAPSPGPRKEEADFPFELDGVEDDKSTHPTPFSQRLAASRSPQSTSEGGQSLTDEERRAKTAALKKALMDSASPESSASPLKDDNPFNARNLPANNYFPPRHTSNPVTPTYQNGYNGGQNQYFQYMPTSPNRNPSVQSSYRPPSSNLRNVYEPAFSVPMSPPSTAPAERVSTARSPSQPQRQLNFGAIYGGTSGNSRPQSEGNPVRHNSKPSLEQGLDDLKKALNMEMLRRA